MANTLGIQERTLAQISAATNTINLIDPTGDVAASPRKSAYQPIVCRVTDHEDNVGAEVGTDTDKMAIFRSQRHGEPWLKDTALKHVIIKAAADPVATPTPVDVTVLYPNFDYSTFE